ncbi:hypothetical protein FGK63_06185 [Ruegeria sediminis]|uniref:Divergent polysaccharide deacetylase family protein n=1 Tax=Ruegeria sediminis TaxID=2583820 RepID=A0ABY2X0E0_9RHOB|nr:polysaccharide deacteylase family 2 protein [Ruegeria sediminis]TMV08706.1 hypothetical protein FGK63_06185 [Ruegeria sediminis]
MSRFLGGMTAGAVVVVAMGAFLSLNTPMSHSPLVASKAPATEPPGQNGTDSEVKEPGADADLVELAPHAPKDGKAKADCLAALDEGATKPSDRPAVGGATGALKKPEAASETGVDVATVAPVAPPAPSALPNSPQEDIQPVVVDNAPSQPTAKQAEPVPASEPGKEEPAEQAGPQIAAIDDKPAEPPIAKPEPALKPEPSGEAGVEKEDDETPSRPRMAALPQIGGAENAEPGVTVGTRVVPLIDRDKEPEVVELPAIKPIEAHAAAFANPEGRPLMSIVLIDDEGSFGVEALQDFPYPLSFAVSPTDPQAAEKMARHRAAGFEVLAMVDLHEAASAQDAEVSMSVWLDTLPETVGILEGTASGIQGNRKLADQVAAIAGGTGRGLLTQDSGLNTVQKLAARNGVPSAVVFRDFDGAGQETKTMRRFLDQAAFRAGQEGAVVMLGRVRPETISALLLWGLEDATDRVALAPISAVLMKSQE